MKLFFVCSVASLLSFTMAEAQTYYVSPSGNDANPGTLAQPLRTLARARDVVRGVNANMGTDITIYLRGGRYNLTNTLTLDYRDSGTNGHSVIWQSYGAEIPVVMGAQILTGWQLEGDKYKVYVGPNVNSRQLYVNGVRAVRARSAGVLSQSKNANGFHITSLGDMTQWGNPADVELVGQSRSSWKQHRCQASAISGYDITITPACWDASQTNSPTIWAWNYVDWVENAYELLDSPGEWYLNRSTGWLYYKPRPGEDMATADVVLPILQKLVDGQGTATNPLANTQFKGIAFAYATWLPDAYGFSDFQANFRWYGGTWHRIPANVDIAYGRNVRFEKCYFTHLGAAGLSFNIGTQNSQIIGNHLCDTAGTPLIVADTSNLTPSSTDRVTNIQIANNYVHDGAQEFAGGPGMTIGIADALSVTHNELTNLPYTAISYGWNWWPANSPSLGNTTITYNYIHNVMNVMTDGGGIYVTGAQTFGPSTVDSNYITGDNNEFGALYADQGAWNFRFTSNVLFGNVRTGLFRCAQYIHNNWWNNGNACTGYPQANCNYYYNGVPQNDATAIGYPCSSGQDIGGNTNIADVSQAPSTILSAAGLESAYLAVKTEPNLNGGIGTNTATAPTITSASPLLSGSVGANYSQTISASGTTPITWSLGSGSLPAGLKLDSSTGSISGTPQSAGPSSFVVQASNSAGSNSKQFALTIGSAPAISTVSPLASGMVGTLYSQTLTATGDAPIAWTVLSGALPAGLSLSPGGVISGMPSTAGGSTVTVRASNAFGVSDRTFSLTIASAPTTSDTQPPTIQITNPSPGLITGTVRIAVLASDNTQVASVQYRLDGVPFGTGNPASSFSYDWNTSTLKNRGWHSLDAVATDAAGNTGTSAPVRIRTQ